MANCRCGDKGVCSTRHSDGLPHMKLLACVLLKESISLVQLTEPELGRPSATRALLFDGCSDLLPVPSQSTRVIYTSGTDCQRRMKL